MGLLCLGALIGVGPGRTFAAFSSSSNTSGSSFSSSRIFDAQRSTTAWNVSDAADATASDESSPQAFADAKITTTGNFANTWSATRYVEFEMNSSLPAGVALTDAAFDFTFSDDEAAGGAQFCYYIEVRSTSPSAALATYGSSGSPIGCEALAVTTTISTPLPVVTSTDIANNLTIRVYGQHSGSRALRVDKANVSQTIYGNSMRLYAQRFTDRSTGTATTTPWGPAAAGDGANFQTVGNWSNAFAGTRFVEYTFPAYVPGGGIVTSASLDHSYRSQNSADTTCWYFEVYSNSNLIGTHGSTGTPVSCNGTASYVSENVTMPEVTTPFKANNITVRIYMKVSGGRKSQEDLVRLNVNYSLGTQDVDSTPPSGSDFQTVNVSGGTAGRPELGDQAIYTFSEPMDPNSILSGWNGTSTNVVVRITNSGTADDAVSIWDPTNATQLALGSADLNGDSVSASATFGASGTPSTMVKSGSTITVTLGTASAGPRTANQTVPVSWTPSASAKDMAGNACLTTLVTESGALDVNF